MYTRFVAALVLCCAPLAVAWAASTPDMNAGTGAMSTSVASGLGKKGGLQAPQPKAAVSSLPDFKKVDTNGDGKIEWAEAKAQNVPRSIFDKEDYEKNGSLDESEWMLVGFDVTEASQKVSGTNG